MCSHFQSFLERLKIARLMKTTCLQSSLTSREQRQNRLVNYQQHIFRFLNLRLFFFFLKIHTVKHISHLTSSKHTIFSHWALCVSPTYQAALHGVRFNNQMLRLAWHKAVTLSPVDADEAEQEEDEVCGHLSLCLHLMISLRRHD